MFLVLLHFLSTLLSSLIMASLNFIPALTTNLLTKKKIPQISHSDRFGEFDVSLGF